MAQNAAAPLGVDHRTVQKSAGSPSEAVRVVPTRHGTSLAMLHGHASIRCNVQRGTGAQLSDVGGDGTAGEPVFLSGLLRTQLCCSEGAQSPLALV